MNVKGQTLVEVVIAMTVISIVSLFFLVGISAAANVFVRGTDISIAAEEASLSMERKIDDKEAGEKITAVIYSDGKSENVTVNKITVKSGSDPEITYEYYFPDGEGEP